MSAQVQALETRMGRLFERLPRGSRPRRSRTPWPGRSRRPSTRWPRSRSAVGREPRWLPNPFTWRVPPSCSPSWRCPPSLR
ncbi:hypothetical protein ACFQV4_29025 [Streptomyces thermocarboxydus]